MMVYIENIINEVFDDRILNYGPFQMNPVFYVRYFFLKKCTYLLFQKLIEIRKQYKMP